MGTPCNLLPGRCRDLAFRATSVLMCWLALVSGASAWTGEPTEKAGKSAASVSAVKTQEESSLYVELVLSRPVKVSALKTGDVIEGNLSRDVYSTKSKLFPSGSTVRLTVGKLERRRREPNAHWPGVIRLFAPRYENYPTFQSASVSSTGGAEVPLQVSLISIARRVVEVHAPAKARASSGSATDRSQATETSPGVAPAEAGVPGAVNESAGRKANRGQTLVLEAAQPQQFPAAASPGISKPPASVATAALGVGTQAQVVLLSSLSASKSRPGDSFHAQSVEPIRYGSGAVLPAGSLFEGKVEKSKAPRWLSRPGSLYLTFTGLTLPAGNRVPVVAHITGAEADRHSQLRLGAEGELSGGHPGKAWMLINLGVTAGVAKETDDAFQVIAEALVSSATDASTAGAARIVAACASTLYMVTRHGRDVVLPRFTRMEIAFDRPVASSGPPQESAR